MSTRALCKLLASGAVADFACGGAFDMLTMHTGGFAVDGDLVALPCTSAVADWLKGKMARSAHGRGEATVVDEDVRNSHDLAGDRVSWRPAWQKRLDKIVKAVCGSLGLERVRVTARPYKLILYEAGGHFKVPHRDTEKWPRMFGTLLVSLPCVYTGGALTVRHAGSEKTFFGGSDGQSAHWAAFYADAEHSLSPVQSGHRLVLSFALCHDGSGPVVTAPISMAPRVAHELTQLYGDMCSGLLVWQFAHRYTKVSLDADGEGALKGTDRALYGALRGASVPLCLMYGHLERNLTQHGSGWDDMEEVHDEEEDMRLADMRAFDADTDALPAVVAINGQNVDVECIVNGPPSEWTRSEEVNSNLETTGNEGVTAEFTYRRIVLCAVSLQPAHLLQLCRAPAQIVAAVQWLRATRGTPVDADEVLRRCAGKWSPETIAFLAAEPNVSVEAVGRYLMSVMQPPARNDRDWFNSEPEQPPPPASALAPHIAALFARFGAPLQNLTMATLCVTPEVGLRTLALLAPGSCPDVAWAECVQGILERGVRAELIAALSEARAMPAAHLETLLNGVALFSRNAARGPFAAPVWGSHRHESNGGSSAAALVTAWVAVHQCGCAQLCAKIAPLINIDTVLEAARDRIAAAALTACPVLIALANAERVALRKAIAAHEAHGPLGFAQPDAVFPRDASIQNFLRGPHSSMVYNITTGGVQHARNFANKYFGHSHYSGEGYKFASASPGGRGSAATVTITKDSSAYAAHCKAAQAERRVRLRAVNALLGKSSSSSSSAHEPAAPEPAVPEPAVTIPAVTIPAAPVQAVQKRAKVDIDLVDSSE